MDDIKTITPTQGNVDRLGELSKGEIKALVHELRVHQIELRMQNDALSETQLELEESRNRYFDLYNSSPAGYITLDANGTIIEANNTIAELLDIETNVLLRHNFNTYLTRYGQEIFYSHRKDAYATNEKQQCELKLIRKDKSIIYAQIQSIARVDSKSKIKSLYMAITDITQHQKDAEQIRQHQAALTRFARQNSMGQMVSNIAHELNQPLSAIINYSNGCIHKLKKMQGTAKISEAIKQVVNQAERAASIIANVKRLLCKTDSNHIETDINEMIRGVIKLLDLEISSNQIDIHLKLGEIPTIMLNKVQIEQVLINMADNAIDALANIKHRSREITFQTLKTDNKVEIIISDTGCGIPPSVQKNIFKPYITTKDDGMGMGLAICESILQDHHGSIELCSSTEYGTQYVITLPISDVIV